MRAIGRMAVAGLLAGVVLFAWGFASHALLGLTLSSFRAIPDEPVVLRAMWARIHEPGLYLFPDAGASAARRAGSEAQRQAFGRMIYLYGTQPHGLLAVSRSGEELDPPGRMLRQLGIGIACGLLAALLVWTAAPALGAWWRVVAFTGALGVFAVLLVDGPYVVWYGFPARYLLERLIDAAVGWLLAGVAFAPLLRRRPV